MIFVFFQAYENSPTFFQVVYCCPRATMFRCWNHQWFKHMT